MEKIKLILANLALLNKMNKRNFRELNIFEVLTKVSLRNIEVFFKEVIKEDIDLSSLKFVSIKGTEFENYFGAMYVPKWDTILINEDEIESSLLVHEIMHQIQFKRTGLKAWYQKGHALFANFLYTLGYKKLYNKTPLEKEAYEAQYRYELHFYESNLDLVSRLFNF